MLIINKASTRLLQTLATDRLQPVDVDTFNLVFVFTAGAQAERLANVSMGHQDMQNAFLRLLGELHVTVPCQDAYTQEKPQDHRSTCTAELCAV